MLDLTWGFIGSAVDPLKSASRGVVWFVLVVGMSARSVTLWTDAGWHMCSIGMSTCIPRARACTSACRRRTRAAWTSWPSCSQWTRTSAPVLRRPCSTPGSSNPTRPSPPSDAPPLCQGNLYVECTVTLLCCSQLHKRGRHALVLAVTTTSAEDFHPVSVDI